MSGQLYSLAASSAEKEHAVPAEQRLDKSQSPSGGVEEKQNVPFRIPNHDLPVTQPVA